MMPFSHQVPLLTVPSLEGLKHRSWALLVLYYICICQLYVRSCILDKHCDKEKVPCIGMWRKWQIADALNHLKKALNCQLCMSNSFNDISLKSTCGCCIGWKPFYTGGKWSIATVTNSYLQTYLYIHALFSIASHIPHLHWGQNNSQEL